MLVTNTHTSVSAGGTSASGQNAYKKTLETGTTGFKINAKFTTGAGGQKTPTSVRVWFATSSFSVTAANAVFNAAQIAESIEVKVSQSPGTILLTEGDLVISGGGYVYIWLEWGKLDAAGTLDVDLVEFP